MRTTVYSSLLFLLAVASTCAPVGSGQVGVLWRASDGTQAAIYGEGLHPVAKWNKMYVYDVRSLSRDEPLSVLAMNGLGMKLGTTIRWHIMPSEAVAIQEEVGPQYYEKIVRPLLGSEARRVFSQYTPEEIYGSKRAAIESEIATNMRTRLADRHVRVEGFLVRDVELPASIRTAIDHKLIAEQKALETRSTLAVARAAAEQKQIEAQGIADYNRIVRPSLSHEMLEYERLAQLSKLATSPNTKEVVVGTGSGNTPTPMLLTGPK